MEVCYKCGRNADFICPDCGSKVCRAHMELRYIGPNRGFKSHYMCPVCWKIKHKVLNEQMIRSKGYKPKLYVFNSFNPRKS